MRKILACILVTSLILMSLSTGYTNASENSVKLLDVDDGRILCSVKANEVFIPIFTAGHIVWAQGEYGDTNLMSCNVETGEVIQINEEPIRYIYDVYPGIISAYSDGWVAYMSNSAVNEGVLWIAPVDGSQAPKSVTTADCTHVSYPEFFGDSLFFWQKAEGEGTSGVYAHRMTDEVTELVYELEHEVIYKLSIDGNYIVIYKESHVVTIITLDGELVREIDFEEDESVESATIFDMASGWLMVGRSLIISDPEQPEGEVYREVYRYSLYNITDNEIINLNNRRDLGSLSNCIRISPGVFAFLKLYPIEDLYKETLPGIWSINIVDPYNNDIQSYPYNGPQTTEKDTRTIHHSSVWNDLVLYPSGEDPTQWFLDLHDTKNRTTYRVTEKANRYMYPTIHDWCIVYFIEGMEEGKYNLVMHRVGEFELVGEQEETDSDRELIIGEKQVCVESENIYGNFLKDEPSFHWSNREPSIKVISDYVVWKEKLDDIITFKSYSFAGDEVIELMQTSSNRLYSGSNQIQSLVDSGHLAVMKEDEATLGWRVFVVRLDGSGLTMIGKGESFDDHLLEMRDGKVYVYEEYRSSKLSCITEYDIDSGSTVSLFSREILPRTFYKMGEKFLINSEQRVKKIVGSIDLLVVDRDGKIQRNLMGVLPPAYPQYWSFYTIDIVTENYVFYEQSRIYLDYSAPLDYRKEIRLVCYNLDTDGMWYLPFYEFIHCNNQRNCNTILIYEWRKATDLTFSCSALNLESRAINELGYLGISFFNWYNTSRKSINDDMLAIGNAVYTSDNIFEEMPTYTIYLTDIKTNKRYIIAEELEYCDSICLAEGRIVYLEPSDRKGYNIVTHTIMEKVPDEE